MKNKVLIACPLGGLKQYSINRWFDWIANQTHADYDVCVCVNGTDAGELATKLEKVEITDIHGKIKKIKVLNYLGMHNSVIQIITFSREKIRRYAVEYDYDYIFWLDSDTIPVNLNAISQLINREVSAISGIYFYKNSKQPVIIDQDTKTNISLQKLEEYYNVNEIIEVWGFGYGCLLQDKETFESCPFDYALFGEERTDDFGNCHVMEQKGIKRFVDPKVMCRHLGDINIKQNINSFLKFLVNENGQNKNPTKNQDKRMD